MITDLRKIMQLHLQQALEASAQASPEEIAFWKNVTVTMPGYSSAACDAVYTYYATYYPQVESHGI